MICDLELGEEETTPWGREECPFTVLSVVEGGLRFPLNPLITEFLCRTGLAPTQVSTNTYRIINGVHELNNRLGISLGLAEVLRQYTMGHTGDGLAYYLKIRPGREKIVTGTPDKDLHDDDFFWVSGNYETAEVPGWMISKNFGSTCKPRKLARLIYFLHVSVLSHFLSCFFCSNPSLASQLSFPQHRGNQDRAPLPRPRLQPIARLQSLIQILRSPPE